MSDIYLDHQGGPSGYYLWTIVVNALDLGVSLYPKDFAVLIPIHDTALGVYDCLDSVLRDVPLGVDITCVLHNPDSNLISFIENYSQRSRIRLLKAYVTNLSEVLNLGLRNIQRPWVFRMDSDDIWLSGRYENQVSFLHLNRDAWVIGGAAEVSDRHLGIDYELYVNSGSEISPQDLLHGCPIIHPSTLINRSQILGIGGYNENFVAAEDYELWSRVIFKGKIYRQNQKLIRYFISSNSQSLRKKEIQEFESQHIMFNTKLRMYRIPTCKQSHPLATNFYCRSLVWYFKVFGSSKVIPFFKGKQ